MSHGIDRRDFAKLVGCGALAAAGLVERQGGKGQMVQYSRGGIRPYDALGMINDSER